MSERYRTIVVDPPWPYPNGFGGFNGQPGQDRLEVRRPLPYASMKVNEIAKLPIQELIDDPGGNVFLWTTNRYLHDAFHVLQGWGARYGQTLVWHKTGANPLSGAIAPTACEFLLFARVGCSVPRLRRWPSNLVTTKRPGPGRHSQKPEVFLDLIEQASPGPYLEMFARRARFGWDYWGDESLGTAELIA